MRWTDFLKYKVGKKMVLVYHSDALFQMFPKRWFSEDEWQKFLDILREALGQPSA